MGEQTQLIYPTVDLFLYDLREGLGQDSEQIERNRERFWEKISTQLSLAELTARENPEADYIELLKRKLEPPLDGNYYALQLRDTYALKVNCCGSRNKEPISELGNLKQKIISHISNDQHKPDLEADKGTLGQTWLVWGQLSDSHQDPKEVTKECYNQLAPNQDLSKVIQWQGELLGATVFEFWELPSDWDLKWKEFSQKNYHLLVFLFPGHFSIDFIEEKVVSAYFDFIRLFCYRHKILWAYWQSRRLETQLKVRFKEIKKMVKTVQQLAEQIKLGGLKLNQLQLDLPATLITLSDYAVDLNYLEDQGRTIKINLENYKKRLEKIEPDNNLLQRFCDFADERFRQQVETDYANLSPGLTLLENLISTTRGIIEIEQTKSDRQLNNTIAIAGVGLATSEIAAAVILVQAPTNSQENPLAFQITAFFGSLGIGVLFAIVTALFILRRDRGSKS